MANWGMSLQRDLIYIALLLTNSTYASRTQNAKTSQYFKEEGKKLSKHCTKSRTQQTQLFPKALDMHLSKQPNRDTLRMSYTLRQDELQRRSETRNKARQETWRALPEMDGKPIRQRNSL